MTAVCLISIIYSCRRPRGFGGPWLCILIIFLMAMVTWAVSLHFILLKLLGHPSWRSLFRSEFAAARFNTALIYILNLNKAARMKELGWSRARADTRHIQMQISSAASDFSIPRRTPHPGTKDPLPSSVHLTRERGRAGTVSICPPESDYLKRTASRLFNFQSFQPCQRAVTHLHAHAHPPNFARALLTLLCENF